jgi:hypothetical protein
MQQCVLSFSKFHQKLQREKKITVLVFEGEVGGHTCEPSPGLPSRSLWLVVVLNWFVFMSLVVDSVCSGTSLPGLNPTGYQTA